jgi:hypothetical protein
MRQTFSSGIEETGDFADQLQEAFGVLFNGSLSA